MADKRLKWRWLVIGAAVAILIAGVVFALIQPVGPPALPPLPSPNGYDDLCLAGARLIRLSKPGAPSSEDLRHYVETSREVLELACLGLSRPCRVPLEYTLTYHTRHRGDLARIKGVAWTFTEEGRLAEAEHRYDDAARSYVDAIRIGHACRQGGRQADLFVGIVGESLGLRPLKNLAPRLDAMTCREVIHVLEGLEATRESLESIRGRDRAFSLRTSSWQQRVFYPIDYFRYIRPSWKYALLTEQAARARLRLLLSYLAIRAYELEEGHPPPSLTALVPTFLKAQPLDPHSGKPFIYHVEEGGCRLYSVGPDRKDVGGTPIGRGSGDAPPGDVLPTSWP